MEPGRGRDVDQYERVLTLRILLWSLPGAILGGLGGLAGGHPFLGALIGGGTVYLFVRLVIGGAGKAVGAIHAPSGRSTPREKEYSAAEALAMAGRYEDAVSAFELALGDDATQATPYLRIARINRDDLVRFEDAARWFRRGLANARLSEGQTRLVLRELVELYMHRMNDPRRAAPYLARMAEELQGTQDGDWAARTLEDVKASMADEADEN